MKFFHVYNEECMVGLEKNGLINKDTGFKVQNVFSVPNYRQFNNIAAKGGALHNLIREGKFPFYVDRIAGGVTYFPYAYNQDLIAEYTELLGDWFLGFQLHESGSNRRGDWNTLLKIGKGPFDREVLHKELLSDFAVTDDGIRLHNLSQDSIDFYATQRFAETYDEFTEEMKDMFRRRMAEVQGRILPCDSHYLATKLQNELGMQTFMPEVGCQIAMMRVAVALSRGIAKAYGKTWGTYYECWRATPEYVYSMPVFNHTPINEWYLTQEAHPDDFTTQGPNGGSSRLLQNRIYYHALMSGADYFSEEWGLNCSYTDMQEFPLSDYGKVKKDFIHTAEKLQGIQAVIPFAIVLPKTYSTVEIPDGFNPYTLGVHRNTYLDLPITPAQKDYIGHVEDVIKLFFARNEAPCGNEGHTLTNSRFGDIVDIIYEDTPVDAMQRYEYLIDATPDSAFAKAKAGSGLQILESTDLEMLARNVESRIPQVLPCYVDGLCWLVSIDEAGNRYLSIFNNEGNERSTEKGDTLISEADRTVTVTFQEPVTLSVIKEGNRRISIQKQDKNHYFVEVPAAGFVILKF